MPPGVPEIMPIPKARRKAGKNSAKPISAEAGSRAWKTIAAANVSSAVRAIIARIVTRVGRRIPKIPFSGRFSEIHRTAAPMARAARPARPAPGMLPGSRRCAIPVTPIQARRKERATIAEKRIACQKLSSGRRRQRMRVPVRSPKPIVWERAMAVMPARRALRSPTPVPRARWSTPSYRPMAQKLTAVATRAAAHCERLRV